MAHLTARSAYDQLVNRINKFPQGAPPSELLYQILQLLFTEKEARLAALMPIKPFTAKQAAKLWGMSETEARDVLDGMAERALLLDYSGRSGKVRYVLPPPMAGFFEFSLMRVGGHPDQKTLSELFELYISVEEDFIKSLVLDGETQMGRIFVQEPVLTNENALHVLDYERASHIIKTASHIGIGTCYCRHKKSHLGKACSAPQDICMTFNTAADSLSRHGWVRPIDASECLELLAKAYEHRLVQFGENNQLGVSFICNCCGCCCEALVAARRFGAVHPIVTNFIAAVDAETCTGCGKCITLCPVEGISLVSAHDPEKSSRKRAKIDLKTCLGCGVCVRDCPQNSLHLDSRPQRIITPVDSVHRAVIMAIERGKLQNLIFDNQVATSHRAMAAVIGAILRLPPVKRALAAKMMNSRYMATLIAKKTAG